MFTERMPFYQAIEKERNSTLLVYATGDRPGLETQIHPEILDYFIEHLDIIGKPKRISLFLYTRGGSTLGAWSLVNLIKQFCDEFEVIIPSKAHSAGTLISLGASTIMMTKQATLGPIDPSLTSPLNPPNPMVPQNPNVRVPVSVESIKGYFQLATEDLSIHNQSDLKDIFIHLSNHVHPLVLGDVFRSRTQIQMLAKKLLSKHITDSKKLDEIISFLCSDSGSHDYTIYRREAMEVLGLNIEKPSDSFYKIIKSTFESIKSELELTVPFDPKIILGSNNAVDYQARRVLIESIHFGSHVYVSEGTMQRNSQQIAQPPPLPQLTRTIIEDQRKFEGWRTEKRKN